jgi:hypothetical protein
VLSEIAFRHAVWLFCPAFALHVTEEWPRFTGWAKEHASRQFTQRDYNAVHIAGILISALSAAIVSLFPHSAVVFLFFAFVFAPSVFFNTLFHAGASLLTRTYCPGVITALLIYVPLFVLLTERAYRESLLTPGAIAATLLLAGVFHTWEVGHNVFKAW